jgi:hypothetical protein
MAPNNIPITCYSFSTIPALSMMGNTIISRGTSHLCNGVHDYSSTCKYCIRFCVYKITDLGAIHGALATAFPISRLFFLFFLFFGTLYKTELKLQAKDFKFHLPIIKEITSHLAWSLF